MKLKKRNFTFDLLYVLAIIMVVDDHTKAQLGILKAIFPYDSFFMPLFVFISGYFYKKQNVIKNIKHKTEKIFIPYMIWNVIMLGITIIIDRILKTNWAIGINKVKVLNSIFLGPLVTTNGPSWFVIMLFWVSILYNLIRNVIKPNKINDCILTIISIIAGLISVYLCVKGWNKKSSLMLFVLRTLFYIQFYHLGYIFKEHIEDRIKKANKYIICSICVIINVILIAIYGDKVNFYATSNMRGFSYWYLPIITSITGITFWYIIMDYVANKIKESKIITYIAQNTFFIMKTHLLFANIINILFYIFNKMGIKYFLKFDTKSFIQSAWSGSAWNMNSRFGIIGFLLGITLSIALVTLINKSKEKIRTKIDKTNKSIDEGEKI
ncbi:MAG: hypothetical protein BHV99_06775 [Clostridium sp. 26_21]|nr:MAG: hypothetical protein BHV99_06775 [Clostridium sp. 26_21]